MKTKFTVSLTITIMIVFHLVIVFVNWFVLKEYQLSISNDAKTINTIGQIRGGSQKAFKSYFYSNKLETHQYQYIDRKFDEMKILNIKFSNQFQSFNKLQTDWQEIKNLMKICQDISCRNRIYDLTDTFWITADKTVKEFELASQEKHNLIKVMFIIFFIEILFISLMIIVVYKLINTNLEANKRKMERYISLIDEYVITSTTDLEGNIVYASKAFCNISGYAESELVGQNHNIVRHPDMPASVYESMWDSIKNGDTWKGEIKNRKKDGGAYWVDANISPIYEDGKHIGYTAIRQDTTYRKRVEMLSLTDPLTGLFNRRKLNDIAAKELYRIQREQKEYDSYRHQVYFVILDIDYFKQYNDTFGHDKGDEVLKTVAQVLNNSFKRATDMAFRLGGEEFALILIEDDLIKVKEYIEHIRKTIENLKIRHPKNSVSEYLTASFGMSFSNEVFGYDFEDLYIRADKALYKAKEHGRNRIEVYKSMDMNNG
jgi:diguanylate cyclase (GGDEF)-like protein/PAS domain S-box-containing protein